MELLLLSVPNAIFRHQILPYLELKDIAVLDSATVNKENRKHLHRRLMKRALNGSLTVELDSNAVQWLKTRRICLSNMSFGSRITEKDVL